MPDAEELYKEYKAKVLGYLYDKLRDRDTAEDLCSDVFLKIFEKLDTFDGTKASISTWIYTITRNTLYDYYRTKKDYAELDESFPEIGDFTEDICNGETLNQLADALEKLPEKERDLILFRYYKCDTLKVAAEKLGISYSYAKILHSSALEKLKELME